MTTPHKRNQRELTRRQLLAGVAAGVGGLALGSSMLEAAIADPGRMVRGAGGPLPDPQSSGIEHVVVLMMENRSFDHYFGWLGALGADGIQAGLSYPDPTGKLHPTYHLQTPQGCGFNDPDHSYDGGRIEYNGGACDGWLLDKENDILCIGYYEAADLSFYANAAPHWTVCDQYFAATMGPTYPNRFYQHAAQTDRQDNTSVTATMPTIWDSLANHGVSGRYFFSDVPFTALWGTKYASISAPIGEFFASCAAGSLPAVSFVDPRFVDEGSGTSGDDHPHGDIRVGQYFLNSIYQAVTSSPNWDRTVLVINYDEWGGFFDHIAPEAAPDANPANALRGFRVPCLVISPFARRSFIGSRTYDHTSVLKMIEWRWSLPSLTPRDAAARNLAEVLDFGRADLHAPQWSVPLVVPQPCGTPVTGDIPPVATPDAAPAQLPTAEHLQAWLELRDKAERSGFTLP